MKLSALFAAILFSVFSSEGALVLVENFNYADSPIVGATNSPWNTHSGGGSGNEALVTSGKLQVASARTEDIDASLAGQPYTTSSGTVLYASFTVVFSALPTSAGTYFAHFNPSSFRGVIWASTSGATSGSFRLGIGNSSTSASASSGQLTTNLSLNQNYFVVSRYNVASGLSTVWLNPILETDASVTASDSVTPATISAFSFRQNSGEGTMLIDNLKVGTSFADVTSTNAVAPPTITSQPQSQTVFVGASVNFDVTADGASPFFYQWNFNGTNVANANSSTLSLSNITAADAGNYTVQVSNTAGSTNSNVAILTVNSVPTNGVSLLTYNVKGNGTTDWSTNTDQVMAIGREVMYLNPDIITFNEIPYTNTWQMTNFIKAFLPGYFLATNSGTDGFIRSVIASRYSIVRSKSWLDGTDLKPFGYTNTSTSAADNFTRDLFEAEINVPGFSQHLHVFTTHLKSTSGTTYADAAAKRAAEAAAITNFFTTNLFVLYPNHPYTLSGDMNDSDTNAVAIQRLVSAPGGLSLTNPKNSSSGSVSTYSSSSPSERIDYIFPCGLLNSNIATSQVFRSDRLTPLPPNLLATDSATASDHLPVMMVFKNPYDTAFRITSTVVSNQLITVNWQSTSGRQYRVESSTTLTNWTFASAVLNAAGTNSTFSTNFGGNFRFLRVNRLP